MLKQRIITAIILITLCLSVLFFAPPVYFFLGMLIVSVLALLEWTNLMGVKSIPGKVLYMLLAVGILVNSIHLPLHAVLIYSCLWWVISVFFVFFYPRFSGWFAKNIFIRGIIGLIVIIPCLRALTYLRGLNDGAFVVLYLFVLIWGADTAAYFAGKRFGKTKLLPLVSPGKSVQGAMAAMIFSIILTLGVLMGSDIPKNNWIFMLVLAILTTFFSIIGDLFESLLKRQVGIKDSGKLLPGHGGLLDRIDSLLAASAVFAMGAMIMSR